MSVNWSAVISSVFQAFAPKAAAVLPKIIPTVAASTPAIGRITAGQMTDTLDGLAKYWADTKAVWDAGGKNLPADFVLAEDGEEIAGIMGVPYMGVAEDATKLLAFAAEHISSIAIEPGQGDLSYERDANFKNR